MDLQLIRFAVLAFASVIGAVLILFYLYAKLMVAKEVKTGADHSCGHFNE